MEIKRIADQIEEKIADLTKFRSKIPERAENKATAISNYDKSLAGEMIRLRESEKYPVSIVEKIAKGNCYKERYEMELADGLYKSVISNINAVMAELNGLQSINRHLESN